MRRLREMTCCSYHAPRNAIVYIKSGAVVPKEVLDRIPPSRAKDDMIHSGNMCDPCAKLFSEGKWTRPLAEGPMANVPKS